MDTIKLLVKHKLYQMKTSDSWKTTDKQNLHIVRAVVWKVHIVALVLQQCFPECWNNCVWVCVCSVGEAKLPPMILNNADLRE